MCIIFYISRSYGICVNAYANRSTVWMTCLDQVIIKLKMFHTIDDHQLIDQYCKAFCYGSIIKPQTKVSDDIITFFICYESVSDNKWQTVSLWNVVMSDIWERYICFYTLIVTSMTRNTAASKGWSDIQDSTWKEGG